MEIESKKKGDIVSTLKSIFWVYKIYWQINPRFTLTIIITGALIEAFHILSSFVFARGIDTLLSVSQNKADINIIYLIIAIFFLISVLQSGFRQLLNYADRNLNSLFYPKYQEIVYTKLIKIGIQKLEDPTTNNLIERAKRNSSYISRVFGELTSFVGTFVSMVTSGLIILAFAPHLVFIFILVLIPATFIDRFFMKKLWQYNRDNTEASRSANESAYYLQDSKSLNELLIIGGVEKLKSHFENFISRWSAHLAYLRRQWYSALFGLRALRSLTEAYSDFYIFMQFLSKKISIGNVTFYIGQVDRFTSDINSLANSVSSLFEATLNITDARELLELEEIDDGSLDMERLIEGPEVKFTDVSFKYPNTENFVLKDLNIDIKPGEKIAIVGKNGAGKTTLVKLLLRFYKLDKGTILFNSQNITELKVNDLYKNVSVLFQDYNNYNHLTVAENIEIGDLRRKVGPEEIIKASKHADAHEFISDYSRKYSQVLSEKYKGGIRPSTGQWQKIAIARFFYRRASLLVFDEPTASIDALSEAKIFNRIYKFFKKKTVIIISHRFSTVRNADRILVLDQGRILEQGSHEELMKLKGKYYEAFETQANGYK